MLFSMTVKQTFKQRVFVEAANKEIAEDAISLCYDEGRIGVITSDDCPDVDFGKIKIEDCNHSPDIICDGDIIVTKR